MDVKGTEKIRILLVDDQRLMREGLRTLLELEDDMEIVAEAGDGAAALEIYPSTAVDVVLMDVRMPVMDGVEATRQLCTRHPGARVIILTTFDDDEYVFQGLRAGALGYLLKDVSGDTLADAIRSVAQGGALIEPSIARKVLAEFSRLPSSRPLDMSSAVDLSEREVQILRLLAQGQTNRQMAETLFLAEGTVKNYVTGIFQKLNVDDRTQAALKAKDMGLIQ